MIKMARLKIIGLVPAVLLLKLTLSCAEKEEVKESLPAFAGDRTPTAGYIGQSRFDQTKECKYDSSWSVVEKYQLEVGQTAIPVAVSPGLDGSVFVAGKANVNGYAGTYSVLRRYQETGNDNIESYSLSTTKETVPKAIGVSSNSRPYVIVNEYSGVDVGPGIAKATLRGMGVGGAMARLHEPYSISLNYSTQFKDTVVTAKGDMYVVGSGIDDSSGVVQKPILRKSTDGGTSWTAVNAKVDDGIGEDFVTISSIDEDIWLLAHNQGACSETVLLKSSNLGTTWSESDRFCNAGYSTVPTSKVVRDIRGYLYYGVNTQQVDSPYTNNSWSIRRSTDNGVSWTTVSRYQMSANKISSGYGIVAGMDGRLYASGYGTNENDKVSMVILVSADGASWTVDEVYSHSDTGNTIGYGITRDANGQLWSVAVAHETALGYHWLVRKKSCK